MTAGDPAALVLGGYTIGRHRGSRVAGRGVRPRPSPPALLVDAIADYKLAVGVTRAEEAKKRAKAREAQRH